MTAAEGRIKVGISACLLGEKVRYDGQHKLDHYLRDTLGKYVQWVPVCPEVEMGLPVPREPMRLVGEPSSPRLITRRTGVDHTEAMRRWAVRRLENLEDEGLCGFVFKSRSPSSGIRGVRVYGSGGAPSGTGAGIFGAAFTARFPLLPVEDDGRLHDPELRENFIERVFVTRRWQEHLEAGGKKRGLVEFHTRHKYLIMAHSPEHLRTLGRIVAGGDGERERRYLENLMAGLKLLATVRKNVNVLQHILGYFKGAISADEKREVIEVIEEYRAGYVPLVVPVVLLRHFVRKYDEPYLKGQHYLNPHPSELMLRTHL